VSSFGLPGFPDPPVAIPGPMNLEYVRFQFVYLLTDEAAVAPLQCRLAVFLHSVIPFSETPKALILMTETVLSQTGLTVIVLERLSAVGLAQSLWKPSVSVSPSHEQQGHHVRHLI